MAGSKKQDSAVLLGFVAVSKTAAARIAPFPIMEGFDKKGPEADLQALLAKDESWTGYALAIDPKGKLRLRLVKADD